MIKHYFTDGSYIDFNQDRLNDFPLENLLRNLSKEDRFNNQIEWSVLEHSVAVGSMVQSLYGGNVLLIQNAYMHDFQEAIIRDVPTPIKNAVGKAWWAMEYEISSKLMAYYGVGKLSEGDQDILDEIDRTMAFVEACQEYSRDMINYMQSFREYDAELLVYCCDVHNKVKESDVVWDENGEFSRNVVQLYKEILTLGIQ